MLALYRYEGAIDNAVRLVNAITEYQGRGHTCGIHTRSDKHAMALAFGTKTARVMVNQNLNEGAGSPRNGLPYTLSLSCGNLGRRHHHRERERPAVHQPHLRLTPDCRPPGRRASSLPGALGSIREMMFLARHLSGRIGGRIDQFKVSVDAPSAGDISFSIDALPPSAPTLADNNAAR